VGGVGWGGLGGVGLVLFVFAFGGGVLVGGGGGGLVWGGGAWGGGGGGGGGGGFGGFVCCVTQGYIHTTISGLIKGEENVFEGTKQA